MERLSFSRVFKGCLIGFLLIFVFLTQMFLSGGLYKSFVWLDWFYREQTQEPSLSVTTLMTPEIIKNNKSLIEQSIAKDAIFIEGGDFAMGPDDCSSYTPMLYVCARAPVYPVKLNSFSMLKFKITNRDFDTFQADTGTFANPHHDEFDRDRWEKIHKHGDLPAIINWTMADNYCQWLGKLTGLPVALPTEAQWEYAARNRGQRIAFMTNNNKLEPGLNIPSFEMKQKIKDGYRTPVGHFPPSPLGLYDLSGNGMEWVSDWYSEKKPVGEGPFIDPKGPTEGYLDNEGPAKVLRPSLSSYSESFVVGMTVHARSYGAVSASIDSASSYSARCVVNHSQRIAAHE